MDVFEFWQQEFGEATDARDYSGRKVARSQFGRYDNRYGWVIEPIDARGASLESNMHVVNVATEIERHRRNKYARANKIFSVQRRGQQEYYDYNRKDFCVHASAVADDLWAHEFGDAETATDFAGVSVHRVAFGTPNGWNVDHIRPLARGGSDEWGNMQITSVRVNSLKADALKFEIDDFVYEVRVSLDTPDKEFESAGYDYTYKDNCIVARRKK